MGGKLLLALLILVGESFGSCFYKKRSFLFQQTTPKCCFFPSKCNVDEADPVPFLASRIKGIGFSFPLLSLLTVWKLSHTWTKKWELWTHILWAEMWAEMKENPPAESTRIKLTTSTRTRAWILKPSHTCLVEHWLLFFFLNHTSLNLKAIRRVANLTFLPVPIEDALGHGQQWQAELENVASAVKNDASHVVLRKLHGGRLRISYNTICHRHFDPFIFDQTMWDETWTLQQSYRLTPSSLPISQVTLSSNCIRPLWTCGHNVHHPCNSAHPLSLVPREKNRRSCSLETKQIGWRQLLSALDHSQLLEFGSDVALSHIFIGLWVGLELWPVLELLCVVILDEIFSRLPRAGLCYSSLSVLS